MLPCRFPQGGMAWTLSQDTVLEARGQHTMEAQPRRRRHHNNIPAAEQQSCWLIVPRLATNEEHSVTPNAHRNDWLRKIWLHIVLVAIQRVTYTRPCKVLGSGHWCSWPCHSFSVACLRAARMIRCVDCESESTANLANPKTPKREITSMQTCNQPRGRERGSSPRTCRVE